MDIDLRSIMEALGVQEDRAPSSMRFQVMCPGCGQAAWVSQDHVGQQVNCQYCDGVMTVVDPDPAGEASMELVLIEAGTKSRPSVYRLVSGLALSTESSRIDMFRAYSSEDTEAEALRQLRDPAQRFACDLLCYPHWRKRD